MMAITQKNLTCRIVKLSKVVGNTSFMCRFIENFISLIEDLTNHFQANADCSFSINKKKWSSIVNYVDICSTLFPNVKLAKAVEESKKIEKHFRFTEKLKKLTTDNHPFKRALRNLSNGSSKKEICSAHNCTFSNYNALYYHLKAYHPYVLILSYLSSLYSTNGIHFCFSGKFATMKWSQQQILPHLKIKMKK